MSPNSQSQNLTRSGGSNPFPTGSSPKYTPRFSAATQMILERIQSGNNNPLSSMSISTATPPPPGYEDMRRSVLQTMKTSMNMNIPRISAVGRKNLTKTYKSADPNEQSLTKSVTSTGNSGKGRPNTKNKNRSRAKRKRMREESEESLRESDEIMSKLGGDSEADDAEVAEPPKITQSGRQIVKPTQFVPYVRAGSSKRRASTRKVAEQALCKRCGRGYTPQSNMIVFCDGCNLPWHQRCHDPIISDAAVQVENSPWYCAECSRKKGIKTGYETTPKGVSWAGKNLEEKKTYLDSLSHSQLVSLLLQATYLHPDIPLFPSLAFFKTAASCLHQSLSSSPSTNSSNGPFSRLEANKLPTVNSVRKIPSPAPHVNISLIQASPAPPLHTKEKREEESRESTPASPPYPRAGHGLMAQLGPDDDDLEWLVDGDDFGAFSHTVYENFDEQSSNLMGIPTVASSIENNCEIHRAEVNEMSVGV